MELQVQRNSPSASPLFPLPLPSPSSVLSWVGGASNIEEGGGGGEGGQRLQGK